MDLRKLKTILELFENSDVAELEISEGEDRVRLSRGATTAVSAAAVPVAAPATSAGKVSAESSFGNGDGGGTGGTGGVGGVEGGAVSDLENGTVVNSPMVGTFYRSASPDRPPFVTEGKRVEKGETLCIIEAMKLMNELPSPVSGVVRSALVGNGEPVGFGDPLFVIE